MAMGDMGPARQQLGLSTILFRPLLDYPIKDKYKANSAMDQIKYGPFISY
jgi:hypothetical protein